MGITHLTRSRAQLPKLGVQWLLLQEFTRAKECISQKLRRWSEKPNRITISDDPTTPAHLISGSGKNPVFDDNHVCIEEEARSNRNIALPYKTWDKHSQSFIYVECSPSCIWFSLSWSQTSRLQLQASSPYWKLLKLLKTGPSPGLG